MLDDLNQAAADLPDPYRVLWREKVGSTNDELRKLAESGMEEGVIFIADEQEAGRGRRGAKWFGEKGEDLLLSVLIRPKFPKAQWHRLSLMTGLALAKTCERYVPLAAIKWPNDVLIGGRKMAGILVEAGADFVIVGIGMNVNSTVFPDGLLATSLKAELGRDVSRAEVLKEVVSHFSYYLGAMEDEFDSVLEGIRERCHLVNSLISVQTDGAKIEGIMRGIGSDGQLLLEIGGTVRAIYQANELRLVDKS